VLGLELLGDPPKVAVKGSDDRLRANYLCVSQDCQPSEGYRLSARVKLSPRSRKRFIWFRGGGSEDQRARR
jgi:hypothetical protein